jgi:hypothetical protein
MPSVPLVHGESMKTANLSHCGKTDRQHSYPLDEPFRTAFTSNAMTRRNTGITPAAVA